MPRISYIRYFPVSTLGSGRGWLERWKAISPMLLLNMAILWYDAEQQRRNLSFTFLNWATRAKGRSHMVNVAFPLR